MSTLLEFGSRAIESWCRPYPMEFMGRIVEFTFDMTSTVFSMTIDTSDVEVSGSVDGVAKEGYALIYLPYVHYRETQSATSDSALGRATGQTLPSPKAFKSSQRIVGNAGKSSSSNAEDGDGHKADVEGSISNLQEGGWEEWNHGEGCVRVDLEILEMGVGRLEIDGQFGRWIYPLDKGEIRLKVSKWRDQLK